MNLLFDGWHGLRADPLPRRAARLVQVVRTTGVWRAVSWPNASRLAAVVLRRGLGVAMLHELHACATPERLALVDERRSLDYRQVDAEINALAHSLRRRCGLGPDRALALATENRSEYLIAWFAAMRLGARVLHAGAHLTRDELLHQLRRGRAGVVLASPATLAAARAARNELPLELAVCEPATAGPGELAWGELTAAPAPFPRRPRRGAESVVFTSGTTGAPKGAMRDFGVFGPTELARVLERLPFAYGDRHLVVGPLHHSAPQVFAILHTALGGTLRLLPHFDAPTVARVLSQERMHSVFLVPTMLRRLLDLPAQTLDALPTPQLRAIMVGSSEFPAELRREAIDRFGAHQVFDFYGATELGWVTLIRGDEMLAHPGSVGRPLAGQEVRVVDGAGQRVPPGTVGLITVRNRQTMLGYAGEAPARGAGAGWCGVEDTGWLDAQGYLHLAGRARDMVKSGGVNVYPAEVEQVLQGDPEIREVAVIGLPDREWGERVVAVVVPRALPFDADAARLRARRRLSPAKVPREWHAVEALPRNANGKVLKHELRERFAPP
jgi:fatty-acyl-CoA synthase